MSKCPVKPLRISAASVILVMSAIVFSGWAGGASSAVTAAAPAPTGTAPRVQTVASGLVHPWAVALLADGRFIVSDRPGRLRIVDVKVNGQRGASIAGLPAIAASGQGGLLGYRDRIELENGQVVAEHKLLERDGARIRDVRQGPDGLLYVLTDAPNGRLLRLLPP